MTATATTTASNQRQRLQLIRGVCIGLQLVLGVLLGHFCIRWLLADNNNDYNRSAVMLLMGVMAMVFVFTPILHGKVSNVRYVFNTQYAKDATPRIRMEATTCTTFDGVTLQPGGKYYLMYTRGFRSQYAVFDSDPLPDHPVGSKFELP